MSKDRICEVARRALTEALQAMTTDPKGPNIIFQRAVDTARGCRCVIRFEGADAAVSLSFSSGHGDRQWTLSLLHRGVNTSVQIRFPSQAYLLHHIAQLCLRYLISDRGVSP